MSHAMSKTERVRRMRAIRSENTRPERAVRSLVHRLGYRFRLHVGDLPGKPDIVLPRLRKVVFVNGCFWHQHSGCPLARVPRSRPDYWPQKFERNASRDRESLRALRRLGWKVLVVWECQTKDTARLSRRLLRFLEA